MSESCPELWRLQHWVAFWHDDKDCILLDSCEGYSNEQYAPGELIGQASCSAQMVSNLVLLFVWLFR